jgi:hypothetical protein
MPEIKEEENLSLGNDKMQLAIRPGREMPKTLQGKTMATARTDKRIGNSPVHKDRIWAISKISLIAKLTDMTMIGANSEDRTTNRKSDESLLARRNECFRADDQPNRKLVTLWCM